jgi:hypothetical protein
MTATEFTEKDHFHDPFNSLQFLTWTSKHMKDTQMKNCRWSPLLGLEPKSAVFQWSSHLMIDHSVGDRGQRSANERIQLNDFKHAVSPAASRETFVWPNAVAKPFRMSLLSFIAKI